MSSGSEWPWRLHSLDRHLEGAPMQPGVVWTRAGVCASVDYTCVQTFSPIVNRL